MAYSIVSNKMPPPERQIVTSDNFQVMLAEIRRKTIHIIPANVRCVAILDIADVKLRLIIGWSGLQQHVIGDAINRWTALCAWVRTVG